jgi:hypothetical protein
MGSVTNDVLYIRHGQDIIGRGEKVTDYLHALVKG